MSSTSEKLAANVNLGVFAKATELKKRLWFTFLALVVYRIGAHIPLPGVDSRILAEILNRNTGGILDYFNMFSGGSFKRMTIFALSIMPYITSSIIMQLLTVIVPTLGALKKEGEAGRRKINQYTRYGTVLLATFQGFGIAMFLESMHGAGGLAVIDPGLFFRITTVITLVTATLFLMWLGEQITARGVGNGISLIIFVGIVAALPTAIAGVFELGRKGALSPLAIIAILLMAMGLTAFIVFMERAQRRIIVQYPKRQVGNKMFGGEASHLPLKLNTANVIPPIFAGSLLSFPAFISGFAAGNGPGWVQDISIYLGHGKPLYLLLYVVLIVFFCFFYTKHVFNPVETADNLKKYGGFIPGIRPGKNTADYLDYVLTRLTVIGAAYLSLICAFPELLIAQYAVPFYLGGTSLLIVVNVTLDTVAQIQSHLLAHQYEGLIKKAKLKKGRR